MDKKYIEERRVKMLLENKKILIMGIRNKWSIAFGIAKSAYETPEKRLATKIIIPITIEPYLSSIAGPSKSKNKRFAKSAVQFAAPKA